MTEQSSQNSTERYFPSKRDLWLGILVWAPGLLIIPLVFFVAWNEALIILAIMVPTYAFVAWLWFGTGYKIAGDHLFIYSGPLRWQIKLADIVRVRKANSLLASASLSFDRLEIRYGKANIVYISPLDKAGFLALLRQKCPQAEIEV